MKIPISWLKEFVPNNLKPEEIAKIFTNLGFLIEKIDKDVLEAEVNPNRGDCFSIIGLVREFAAVTGKNLKIPTPKIQEENLDKPLTVDIKDKEFCPRYTYRIIENIEIKDSPKWLKENLEKSDIRPLANIIDVTNYVMLETGQPLHAFDYNKISEDKIVIVRKSEVGEKLITLDGKDHKMEEGMIVIENNGHLIDLAGIMGGENSDVTANTKTIILQAALFDPVTIRKTGKKLGISTEAAFRYERGVDPEVGIYALDRATELILQLGGGKAGKITDIVIKKNKPIIIKTTQNKINHLLGMEISKNEITNLLRKIGFQVSESFQQLLVTVPSWRSNDIKLWQDLAEEIARLKGYNDIPKKIITKDVVKKVNLDYSANQILVDIFSNADFIETLSYSFVSKNDLVSCNLNPNQAITVKNPLSSEYEYLRPKILPTLLKQVSKNPWAPEIKMFEVGKIYSLEKEVEELVAVSTSSEKSFEPILEQLKTQFKIKNFDYKQYLVDQNILKYFKIRRPIYILEIDLEKFFKNVSIISEKYQENFPKIKYKSISKYPPIVRDLAFILDKNIASSDIANEIKNIPYVFLVELFDEFVSDKFGKDKKNLAFHIWLSNSTKTMTEKEAEKVTKEIIKKLDKKFKAKIRDF